MALSCWKSQGNSSYTMFGWVDFTEDGKKEWKIGEKIGEKGVWMRGGGGEKSGGGPAIFSLGPPQFNLSKMGRKWGRKGGRVCWTKLPFFLPWPTFCLFLLFCLSLLFFFLPR